MIYRLIVILLASFGFSIITSFFWFHFATLHIYTQHGPIFILVQDQKAVLIIGGIAFIIGLVLFGRIDKLKR